MFFVPLTSPVKWESSSRPASLSRKKTERKKKKVVVKERGRRKSKSQIPNEKKRKGGKARTWEGKEELF